ncbi:MAG: hypothetical protein PUI06_05915 [Prevotella sp.]|nr:hypothetical protein [Prevotella sp.]MDY5666684.1 hypothetical protein [Alloprevotella sp.]
MTKKFTSVLLLLVSCIMNALAQQVASTPTTWSELTTGNYLVLVKSSKTSDAGNLMYHNSADDYAYVDKKSMGTDLIGSTLNTDQQKYIWKVTKSGNTVTLMSLESSTYIKETDKNIDKATMGKNAQSYTVSDKGGSVELSYHYGGVLGLGKYTTYLTTNGDGTNSDAYIGTSTTEANAAQFVFYKTADVEYVDVTYNYTYNGATKYTCTVKAIDGQAFPECNIKESDRPGFVVFGKPAGNFNKSVGETTFNIELTYNLPFITSTDEAPVYYYLVNGTDTRNRVYANGSSLAIRTDGQAAQLNDVRGDLWYVKGNPFDGFQFSSVGSGHLAKSLATVSDVTELVISGGSTSTWNLYRIDDEAFGIYAYSKAWNHANVAWKYKGNNKIGFEKNLSTTDATKTFRLIPATITMPLNYSKADNKTFATTCLPYAVEVAEGQDNIKAYAGKLNDEKTELQMNAVTAVPANQGIILSGESASDNEVVLNVVASADAIDNDLLGTTSEISTEGIFALGRANGTGNVGFFRSGNATLPANRAYIKLSDESIQSLAMNFGTVTGINNATNSSAVKSNAPIYDLSGRRVFNTVKGSFYIQQGRKFIAK